MYYDLGMAHALDENTIIFSELGNIYKINLKNNSQDILFVLSKYEAKEFNYYAHMYRITAISSIYFPPSSSFTVKQI